MKDAILWNLEVNFFHFLEKFSLVLLQMTNYTFSPWKMEKRMQYVLNYSSTRVLSTENQNYPISWWIPSLGQMSKIGSYTNKMKWENSTVQLINGLVKAAGMHCMLIMILWLLKKQPTNDLLLYFFLLEYSIDILDKKKPFRKTCFLLLLVNQSENLSGQSYKNSHRLRLPGGGEGSGGGGHKIETMPMAMK